MSRVSKDDSPFHPRNKHEGKYDFQALIASHPTLEKHVAPNKYGNISINFFDPFAVKELNTALLKNHYGISYWDFPKGALCPPIPGRADYIHNIADLIYEGKKIDVSKGSNVTILDVGTGSSMVYPIIGNRAYGWSFICTEINDKSIASAQNILSKNKDLLKNISLRKQPDSTKIFRNMVEEFEYFDVMICNPPFYGSEREAVAANTRKNTNLGNKDAVRNFGGMQDELWCHGGEVNFIRRMMDESAYEPTLCYWYTTLVSRDEHLQTLERDLERLDPTEIKVIDLGHGNKKSRILCWTYLTDKQRKAWSEMRWR